MPFALIGLALVLLVSGVRGTEKELGNLIVGDFKGPNSFIYWLVSVMAIGGLGYIPKLKPVSDAFLMLIILVLFVSNRGFFQKFNEGIRGVANSAPPINTGSNSTPTFKAPDLTIFPGTNSGSTIEPFKLYGGIS